MATDDPEALASAQRSTLRRVLLLNVALVVGLLVAGFVAKSSALIANALDNTSDAFVYGISYYAVAKSPRTKSRVALASGVILIVLAVATMLDVARRHVTGAEPLGRIMIPMAVVAAGVNALCLRLLARDPRQDVHLRAAWTFSINDFVSNFGVLIAGISILLLGKSWPDLFVGAVVASVMIHGGWRIVRDARRSRDGESGSCTPRRHRSKRSVSASRSPPAANRSTRSSRSTGF